MTRKRILSHLAAGSFGLVVLAAGAVWNTASAQDELQPPTAAEEVAKKLQGRTFNGEGIEDLVSSGGLMAISGRFNPSAGPVGSGEGTNGKGPMNSRGQNGLVNDACLDALPSPPNTYPLSFFDVAQSETEIAVLNRPGSMGRKMVAGYNDSRGFSTNVGGLSGFSFTTDGGHTWIDGDGLPPVGPNDQYYGDPVLVVHHGTETFYYASIYFSANGYFTMSVNRGTFQNAPAQTSESRANFACLADPSRTGTPTSVGNLRERIIWDAPVEAVSPPNLGPGNGDFLDKEWMYVDQRTGDLYVTYTRFPVAGATTIEFVKSTDGGQTWSAPVVVNSAPFDRFNQASQPASTPDGRIIVTWFGRGTFLSNVGDGTIEASYSDDGGATWSPTIVVAHVNTQAEPRGYNRGRFSILNAPFIAVDNGQDDGVDTPAEAGKPGFGNVYITYFSGTTPGGPYPTYDRSGDIYVSRSTDGGETWDAPVKVNDDNGSTSHVFPSVQVNKNGQVLVTWLDRRLDEANNVLTDTWGAGSSDQGASFGTNTRLSDISASWYARSDVRPNFGDYNSSELIGFNQLISIWSDGRFRPPGNATVLTQSNPSTPDVYTQIMP